MVQIKYQRQQKHGRRRIPKGIVGLAALGRRTLKEVRHKPLHIVIVPEIHEGVITMAALHIQQIQHTHFIALLFQQITRIPCQFTFVNHFLGQNTQNHAYIRGRLKNCRPQRLF